MGDIKNILYNNSKYGAWIKNKTTGAHRFFIGGVIIRYRNLLHLSVPTGYDDKYKKILINSNGDTYSEFFKSEFPGDGYVPIKKTEESGWQLLSEDFSSLSEEFYEVSTNVSLTGHDFGMALVRKNRDSLWQFRDSQGKLSPELHKVDIGGFWNGVAIVKTGENKGYQYITPDFNLSEEFYSADVYYNGMAVVKKSKDSKFQFRDLSGNLSEEFDFAERYSNGFAKVIPVDSSYYYRDLLGNLSKKRTQLGKDYFNYIHGRVTVYDLSDECFGDDTFLQTILQQEQDNLQYYCQFCETQEQLEELYESSVDISDYVKGKAYDAYLLKTQQQQVSDVAEENKIAGPDDDLNKRKAELQESLQKMF